MIKIVQIASVVWFAFQRVILPLLLPILEYIIKEWVDELQEELKRQVEKNGPGIIDQVFDKHQLIVLGRLKKLRCKSKP